MGADVNALRYASAYGNVVISKGTDVNAPLRYQTNRILGKGSYGKVYLVTDTQTNTKYALKINDTDICDSMDITTCETDILMRLQHPYLIRSVDVFRPQDIDMTDVKQGVLLPLMDYDLSVITRDDKTNPKYPDFDALRASWQLACALEALYAAGYTHFDIKPANILQKGDTTYLSDFGLSYSTSTPSLKRSLCTISYRPPYVNSGVELEKKDYMAADLYSLGLTFLDIITKHNYRPDWRSYEENDYVRLVAKEANEHVDFLIKFINDNRATPKMLVSRQKRWNLPIQSLDDMVEYLNLIKSMISPTPTALTATQVRLRLEALWPAHPPAPTLRMSANPPTYEPLRATATRVVTSIFADKSNFSSYINNNPRVVPHVIELFLAVSKFATPDAYIKKGLNGHISWRVPYLLACMKIVLPFYSPEEMDTNNAIFIDIPYDPRNDDFYDDTKSISKLLKPYPAMCQALKKIAFSTELSGRYNLVLPGEISEFVPT